MKREKRRQKVCLCKLLLKTSPNLRKQTDDKIQEAQRTPTKFNKSWPLQRPIIAKFTTYTEKAARGEKSLTYKGRQRFTADLSTEI